MNVEIKNGRIEGYMTTKEAAKKWDCGHTTICFWIKTNKIPKMNVILLNITGHPVYLIKEDTECPRIKCKYTKSSTFYTQFDLSEKEDTVLRCIEVEGLTFAETSRKLKMPDNSVSNAYYRALAKILKQGKTLEEYLHDDSTDEKQDS